MCARTPSRSFGHSGISYKCFARASSAFWFDPGRRSHLKTEQFRDAPDVIAQSGGHGRGAWIPEMLFVPQLVMRKAKIIRTSDQIHPRLDGLQTMSCMPTFAREASQAFTHGPIEALNKGGVQLASSQGRLKQCLGLLKGSPRHLAR